MRSAVLFLLCLPSLVLAQSSVVLISIDGFSQQYLDKYQPKNILKLAKNGVVADALIPVFPTKTFPNHLSIVTGKYPAEHGIIHNKFYNPIDDSMYKVGRGKTNPNWLNALPIWTVAELQGIKAATYFWPESEATLAGVTPSYYFKYSDDTPNKVRVEQIIKWLKMPIDTRPKFITGYFSSVDTTGHVYGPESPEVVKAINEVDNLIGLLDEKISNEVGYDVDIILVSDHGMVNAGDNHKLPWKSLFKTSTNNDSIKVVNGQTQLLIHSQSSKALKHIQSQLDEQAKKYPKAFSVYLKGEFPKHWYFDSNLSVIPDLIVNAHPPFTFSDENSHSGTATHGYDVRDNKDLEAIFIAKGPSFKKNTQIAAFSNTNIFALLIHLLSLEPPCHMQSDITPLIPALKNYQP